MTNRQLMWKAVCAALALEVPRLILRAFFASTKAEPSGEVPALAVFANLVSSPFVTSLQYLGSFSSDDSVPRSLLLLRLIGVDTVREGWGKKPEVMGWIADMLLSVSAWVFHSHLGEMAAWPWRLAILADPSAEAEVKESVCAE